MNKTNPAFTPGRYIVHGRHEDAHLPGPAGSPVGQWHFHVSVAEDGTGAWTNLDGYVVYKFADPGEAVDFLTGCVRNGDPVFQVN
jgi:hypothetical protein